MGESGKTSFSDLALALAKDYESIYVIDSKDDSYVEYTYDNENGLTVRSSGKNFYVDVPRNCREQVWPDDQEHFLAFFKKKNLIENLDNEESSGHSYRLNINGKPQYYYLKAIRINDADIVIGVQNIDKQMRRELKDRERSKVYSEIAKSLGTLFEVIYHVDINTGYYTEYYSSQSFSELGIETRDKDDFFERLKTDIQIHIFEEDREMLIRELDKDNLISKLNESNTHSIVYRQVLDGRMQYVNLIAFKQRNDAGHLVIGVRNIDEQKRQEAYYETYGHIAGALASRYEVIYYIDTDTNEYTQYSSSEQYAKLGTTKTGKDFFTDAAADIKKYIYKDDKERVLRVMNKKHLMNILSHEGSMTMTYRQFLDNKSQYVTMLVVRPKNDDKHLVMGVTNIDAQVKREESIIEESQTFGEIAMALAQRYEVIYQVNLKTNEYLEYSASEKYAKLEVGARGEDFFVETQQNMKKDIFPDDYPMMAVAMQKDYLIKSLKDTGKFFINYRLILDGRPQYVTLLAVKPKEDSDHIIVAISNIDSSRRMELEFEDALGFAMDMANHDSLTGTKNKRYYAQTEMKLDLAIANQEGLNFSIVLCDINGLKKINDKYGHKAGDAYIQDACKMISTVFKHSIVYRIGGDEFAVILENEDYRNRDILISMLDAMQETNRKKGNVTVAYGISDYKPMVDNRVQDVFERADQHMYINKMYYHQANKDESEKPDEKLNQEKDLKFYKFFVQLVSEMTSLDQPNISFIEKVLVEISSMFRLSKAVTYLYKNPQDEAMGNGETLCCYDTGIEGEEIFSHRIVTKIMSIAKMVVYMSPNERPLSDLEKKRVDLVMRTTLTYLSRNRIRDMVEELTLYDDNGYKNLRSFQQYVNDNINNINDRAAFKYNLRHFSLINHDIGRKSADIVMRNHFENLSSMIGDRGIVCRLGGDNFVGLCGKEQLGNVLTYLTETNVIYDSFDGKSVNIASSVGVYRIPENERVSFFGQLMEKIIISSHVAQNGGKDSIVFYNGNLIKNRENAMKVQQLFPAALRDSEFLVYYQPKVDIRTGEIIGAEALCRWFHDEEIISPGEFIPVLEETLDICKLDFYMLDHVCRDIRRWLDSGHKVVRVSINMSRKHMLNNNLLEHMLKIIDRHNVPHSCIEIELTETTTDVEFSDLKRVVSGLQSVGIYTSVDDFGTGYSSLNLIGEMPWNVIKIDRSLLPTKKDEQDRVSMVMFKNIISMANELGMECIVEGVENRQQMQILAENNCFYAQGFLFDKPLPKREFEERLLAGNYNIS